jgi:antitoxin (DNA-binding transcriptional repressor) of toxin-antitoxin stability system
MEQILAQDLSSKIPFLIEKIKKGEEVIVTQDGVELFKISPLRQRPRATFGSAKDKITYIADDFNDTPEGFEEYIQ